MTFAAHIPRTPARQGALAFGCVCSLSFVRGAHGHVAGDGVELGPARRIEFATPESSVPPALTSAPLSRSSRSSP